MSGSHRTPARPSLTSRGKLVAVLTTATLAGVVTVGYFALFPGRAPAFVRSAMASVGIADPPPPSIPPPVCPLTGVEPRGEVPHRPALAIKVENHPEARPQASLNDADVVVRGAGGRRIHAVHRDLPLRPLGPGRAGSERQDHRSGLPSPARRAVVRILGRRSGRDAASAAFRARRRQLQRRLGRVPQGSEPHRSAQPLHEHRGTLEGGQGFGHQARTALRLRRVVERQGEGLLDRPSPVLLGRRRRLDVEPTRPRVAPLAR